jgi:tetratricopeptide (TPR) repeat protein
MSSLLIQVAIGCFLIGDLLQSNAAKQPLPGERMYPRNGASVELTIVDTNETVAIGLGADVRFARMKEDEIVVICDGREYSVHPGRLISQGEVIDYCKMKIATMPEQKWHAMLAMEYFARNQFDKGLIEVRHAVRITPTQENQLLLGQLLLKTGQPEKALEQFNNHIGEYGANYSNLGNRASALAELRKYDEALEELEKLSEFAPSLAQQTERINLKARIRMKQGEFAKARKDLEESIRIDSKNPTTLNRLSWLLATCPDGSVRDAALALFYSNHLINLSSSPAPAHRDTHAAALAANGIFSKAKEQMQLAIAELDKTSTSYESYRNRLSIYEKGESFIDNP